MNEPRIREIYDDYRRGRVSFERVVQAADAYLASYADQAQQVKIEPSDERSQQG